MSYNTVRNIARRVRILENSERVSFNYPNHMRVIGRVTGYVYAVKRNRAGIPYVVLVIPKQGFRSYSLHKMDYLRQITKKQ